MVSGKAQTGISWVTRVTLTARKSVRNPPERGGFASTILSSDARRRSPISDESSGGDFGEISHLNPVTGRAHSYLVSLFIGPELMFLTSWLSDPLCGELMLFIIN